MLIEGLVLAKVRLCFLKLIENNLKVTVAESCTGGLLSFLFTYFPGSSQILDCSFIVYSNDAKIALLGIDEKIISRYGAVSSQTAIAMSKGALSRANAHLAISLTGIAGPEGDSTDKPLGLVYIALSFKSKVMCQKYYFKNYTRNQVQLEAVKAALELITKFIDDHI